MRCHPLPAPLGSAVLQGFLGSPASAARMRVELRSRGLLVTWAAYCMADAAACAARPLVASYGVSLRADDLRHLVLSNRQACDALLGVAAYLRRRHGQPLFSLADGGSATFSFAATFAAADGGMAATLQQEQAAAAARQAEHWRQVQEKQRKVAHLRARLQQETLEEAEAQAAYTDASNAWNGARDPYRHGLQQEMDRCRSKLDTARSCVSRTKGELNRALAAPRPVIQPLPQGTDMARKTLFFAYCPRLLRWAGWIAAGSKLHGCRGRLQPDRLQPH